MPSSAVWHSTAGQEVGPVAHACSFVSRSWETSPHCPHVQERNVPWRSVVPRGIQGQSKPPISHSSHAKHTKGACSPQHLTEQQLGLGSDSSGGWSAGCGAYSASFQRLRLPGSGGMGPCFSRDARKGPLSTFCGAPSTQEGRFRSATWQPTTSIRKNTAGSRWALESTPRMMNFWGTGA